MARIGCLLWIWLLLMPGCGDPDVPDDDDDQSPFSEGTESPAPESPTPSSQTPGDETPTPTDETPGDQTPSVETPGDQTPSVETPGDQTPTDETPGAQTPSDETPDDATPTDETPSDETPGAQTPPDETPVVASQTPPTTPVEPSSTPDELSPTPPSTPETTPEATPTPETTPEATPTPEMTPAATPTPESTPEPTPTPPTPTAIPDVDGDGDGYTVEQGDCNDHNGDIHPDAEELCDNLDNDCDDAVDEGLELHTYYADADSDGYGDPNSSLEACAIPDDYADNGQDCDDGSADIHPGAEELCDELDNDCDGSTDEDLATTTYYADIDQDGFGDSSTADDSCGPIAGRVTTAGDCDDGNADVYPEAPEKCDDLDNDCDGQVDEDAGTLWYTDSDGDGYGKPGTEARACEANDSQVDNDDDCDDTKAAINPSATEICDQVDNNCDGQIDEGLLNTYYPDEDGDGYGVSSGTVSACAPPEGYVETAGDCDDEDGSSYPGADELCDHADNDCDGQVDNNAIDLETWYADADIDDFGDPSVSMQACFQPEGYVLNDLDCDDTDAGVNPEASEIGGNDVDEDCDGLAVAYLDLNLDGHADIVVSSYYDDSTYATNSFVYWGDETGISDTNRTEFPTLGAFDNCVADFDADGYLDIFFANYYDGSSYLVNSYLYWGSPSGFSADDRTELPTMGAVGCAAKDLDSDGDIDLVVTNDYDGSSYQIDSYVYWNENGDFSDAARTGLPTDGSLAVKAVDLNRDGYLELIFSGYYNGSYKTESYIYWGSESGYASYYRTTFETEGAWAPVTVADLDYDGALDIVVNNRYAGSTWKVDAHIYWGPYFEESQRTDLPAPGNHGAEAFDINHDGYLDLVIPCYYDGDNDTSSLIYFGSSSGFSTDNVQEFPMNRTTGVAIRDLNGDGLEDLAFSSYYDGNYETNGKIFYNSEDGFDVEQGVDLPIWGGWRIGAGDVDLDGYVDVVMSSWYDGNYSTHGRIFWSSPRGIEESARSGYATAGSRYASLYDLDGDGSLEIIYSNQTDGSTTVLDSGIIWGQSPWSSEALTNLSTLGARYSCIDDLDDDGHPDIVFANFLSAEGYSTNSYIYWGGEGGSYGKSDRTELPTIGATSCMIADMDADGDKDLVFANQYDGASYLLDSYVYWNDEGTFTSSNRLDLPTIGATAAATADLDKNGYPDLVFSNLYDGSDYTVDVYVYFGDASGFSESRRMSLPANGVIKSAILEDVNDDGWRDILLTGYYDGNNNVDTYIYWGSQLGFFESNCAILPGNRTAVAGVSDLNQDGYTDVVLGTNYDGNYVTDSYIYWGSSSGYSEENRSSLPTAGVNDLLIADVDLDGFDDLVFPSYYDGNYETTSYVYYGSSEGYSESNRLDLDTYGAISVALGDLNGDGWDELVFPSFQEASGDYATTSYVYWNSIRGLSNTNYSEMENLGGWGMTVAEGL